MSDDPMISALRDAIASSLAGAQVEVTAGKGGHYSLAVTSAAFAGKGMLECHRMVMGSIAHLMKGDAAPVHAIDTLKTRAS